ncbi:DUF4255 domain-containing protein [Methylobacterium currus]|uniref:DUF4255 domain-containing protein n=1 Tax=Methylobacterium currus TaxID=2051553 RepID=A0A2R4WMK6_9HYPH|nr:Pvc16 family protein [Methylobacterium currus]AWB22770.1 DUF4255 domain-containing protein [Methylobacterium currus]UHC17637.1 Pvc16 family protein [Methylobacterium currus]
MLDLVDKVVEEILDAGWPVTLAKPAFSFAAPDDTFPAFVVNAGGPVLNIFMTDVRENRHLRRPEWDKIELGAGASSSHPPVYLDIVYVVSAWSPASDQQAADPVGVEHRFLGEALRILLRNPDVVPQAIGLPSGGAVFNAAHVYLSAAYPEGGQPLNDFWTTMKQGWRLAVQLTVTAPLDLLLDGPAEPLVITFIQRFLPAGSATAEQRIQIGGRVVRAAGGAPVQGASVRLMASGREITTDSRGRYSFAGLHPGLHRIRASAAGLTPLERDVSVPDGPPADHIFELS